MGCTPEDDDDLVEAVRLLVAERDEAKADRARLLEYIVDCGRLAVGLVERVHKALETYQGAMRERDAAEPHQRDHGHHGEQRALDREIRNEHEGVVG